MESAGSAVVDFGRFCTGFLVVMGVGMCSFSTNMVEDGRNWAAGMDVMKNLC